jgi:hypothetical protein
MWRTALLASALVSSVGVLTARVDGGGGDGEGGGGDGEGGGGEGEGGGGGEGHRPHVARQFVCT